MDELRDIDQKQVCTLADYIAKYLSEDMSYRRIHVLAKGRSALSTFSFLQGLYDMTYKASKGTGRFRFDPATLRDGVIKYIGKNSLALAVSGSGETAEVVRYLKDAINAGSRTILITASKESSSYDLMKESNGLVFVIESQSKVTQIDGGYLKLLPLGSEFEFKVWILLNSLIPEIEARLLGSKESSCPWYKERFDIFYKNIKLLKGDWIGRNGIEAWIERLLDRHGLFVFYGITKSGHIAEQFEMRFAHLDKKVFMLDDSNRKPFKYGDALIAISGGGNTEDVNGVVMEALGLKMGGDKIEYKVPGRKLADVFGITANKNSKLMEIMRFGKEEKNLLVLPMVDDYREEFSKTISQTIMRPSEFGRWRIPVFETSAYVLTNAIVAQVAENEGVLPQFMKGQHV
ncbi:MAG: SIS domain-containing protein [Candidatus Hydrothermarchaeales archaeon]